MAADPGRPRTQGVTCGRPARARGTGAGLAQM